MRFAKFVLRNLLRSKTRTLLTMLGVVVSIFIFAALLSLDRGVQKMLEASGDDAILTVFDRYKACPPGSKIPMHYQDKIAAVPGVESVMPERFLLSSCRTTTDLIGVRGVDPAKLRGFREIRIDEKQYADFAGEKGAAIVGEELARRYGWQVGQQVTLAQLGGVSFTVRGIFSAASPAMAQMVYVDHTYLEQATNQAGWTTMYLVMPQDPKRADAVASAIDAQFANFEVQTKTGPQKAFVSRMITDFKDMVGFAQIVAWAALLLLLAAVANSMSMTVRDRLREMAILKLMGFDSDGATRLVIAEALIVSTLAAVLGTLLAFLVVNGSGVAISIEGYSIVPQLSLEVALYAVGAGALLGLLGAYWPARSGARLPIVQALREVD